VVVMLDGHDWIGGGINNTDTKYYKYSSTSVELGNNDPETLGKINSFGNKSHSFKFGLGGSGSRTVSGIQLFGLDGKAIPLHHGENFRYTLLPETAPGLWIFHRNNRTVFRKRTLRLSH
jgi:hypothetical protein